MSMSMDEFYFERSTSHVPAFGRWDCYDDLPFTQCFESARQAAGLLRYTYYSDQEEEEEQQEQRDLYVAGDLYENDILTPAVIVVPRSRSRVVQGKTKTGYRGKEKVEDGSRWVSTCEELETAAPKAKAVDEDLYKISPHILRLQQQHHAKKRKTTGIGWGIFSSCLRPTCVY